MGLSGTRAVTAHSSFHPEAALLGVSEGILWRRSRAARPRLRLACVYSSNEGMVRYKIHVWCTWVLRPYTEASLTVPADRLPAISAVARLFYEEMKSPYIAGLWKEGLWYTLCWYRRNSENRASREGPYIAPSWSWASVNAPIWWLIQLPGDKTVQLVTIEEIVVDSGRDPFGRVSSGSIRLKGRALLDQPLNKREPAYSWHQYLDYPGEPPPHLDYILMAEDKEYDTRKFFLLVARSSNNDKLYERHGVARIDKSTIFGLDTSSWPVKTFTII